MDNQWTAEHSKAKKTFRMMRDEHVNAVTQYLKSRRQDNDNLNTKYIILKVLMPTTDIYNALQL